MRKLIRLAAIAAGTVVLSLAGTATAAASYGGGHQTHGQSQNQWMGHGNSWGNDWDDRSWMNGDWWDDWGHGNHDRHFNFDSRTNIDIHNETDIRNDVSIYANTGGNSARGNRNTEIHTGDIMIDIRNNNQVN